ncbi:MAG: dihydrodipicolinate synthase family protein [Pirellulaceae bacterium]|jgi:5-dehydro-4-deoxyglucarate dehydratase|nr:dihydrodipicolinate synthase family protein [Pirellulaceae bacterium]HJN90146.1 dihydrodipicolinate synthase family protein [Verrucomicrobiota bacterium]
MNPQALCSKLKGVIGFPVTPFNDDHSLDLEGHRKNVRYMLKQPMCALVAAGGTGELYSLTPEEVRLVVEATIEEVAGRAPVIAGVGFAGGLANRLAKQAADSGADGVLAFPPYYPNAEMDGLVDYYSGIAEASGLAVLIYSRDWAQYTPEQAERLAEIPNVVAWKDGSADIRRYQMIRQRLGDRLHWIGGAGDDMVPGYYGIGIRAYTSSISAVAPKLSVKLHELGAAGDSAALNQVVNKHVVPLYALRIKRKGYEVSAMKALLDMVCLRGGSVRPPLIEVAEPERAELGAILDGWRDAGFVDD